MDAPGCGKDAESAPASRLYTHCLCVILRAMINSLTGLRQAVMVIMAISALTPCAQSLPKIEV